MDHPSEDIEIRFQFGGNQSGKTAAMNEIIAEIEKRGGKVLVLKPDKRAVDPLEYNIRDSYGNL